MPPPAEAGAGGAGTVEFEKHIRQYEATAVLQRIPRYLDIMCRHLTWRKLVNFFQVELDYRLARPVCRGKPWSAKIEPTNICNLQCPYCPREEAPYGLGMMPLARYKHLIEEIREHTFVIALHLWGEPLLHPELPEMIGYAVSRGLGTYISSNFNRLTEAQARKIIESKLDMLTICVDGADQESYQVFRKGGKLSRVLQNVQTFMRIRREMKSKSPFVELQFLATPKTGQEAARVKNLAGLLGVDSFRPKPVYPILVERAGTFTLPAGEEYFPITRRAKRKTCWWLWRTVTIAWDGSVLPCCRVMFASALGNVFQTAFAEIWNNERYQGLRRTFAGKDEGERPCSICHVPYTSIHG